MGSDASFGWATRSVARTPAVARGRAWTAVLLAGLLGGGCAGTGGASPDGGGSGSQATGGSSGGPTGGSTPAAPTPPPAPPLDPARLAQARAEIDAAVSDPSIAGRMASVLVVDDESGEVVYALNPDQALIPASNTKLFTTAAALALLGPDYRLRTRALSAATIDAAGDLAGDLILHSGHDFTLSTHGYESARFPLDQLAGRLRAAGLRRVSGALRVYGAWCYDGSAVGTYDPAAHRAAVLAAFQDALAAKGIALGGGGGHVASMDPPQGLATLAGWESLPLSVACDPINVVSHNEMADALCRHLGWVRAGASDYAAGTGVVAGWVASLGVPGSVALYDGSGLDVRNRVSARQTVELLRRTLRLPIGPAWASTFAIGGVTGTLAGRMSGADVRGRFFGKSGTNLGICTSGFLVNRHDGRRYVVSALMNTLPSGGAPAARLVQDRIVAAVSGDLRGAGPRPVPPVLAEVSTQGAGALFARWGAVAGAQGYLVEPSDDGVSFPASARIYTTQTSLLASGLFAGTTLALRVRAVSTAGVGDPSDAYAARVGAGAPEVLIVDANDRFTREAAAPENVIGATHAFAAETGFSLPRGAFDTCANEEVASGAVDLSRYRAVLWLAGEDGSVDTPIDAAEQAALRAYASAGGRLLVSGAEVLWDLDRPQNADPQDHAFARDVLGAAYAGDDAGTYVVEGAGGPLAAVGTLGFFTPGAMRVSYPDQLTPLAGATPWLRYAGGLGGVAAVARTQGASRVITFGFPLESIDARPDRARVLDAVLTDFGL